MQPPLPLKVMENIAAQATSTPGVLHYIPDNLTAFEPSKPLARSLNINTLVWIDGMFGTPGNVNYPFQLAPSLGPMWSLVICSLSSAGMSWGVKTLTTDAEDMAKIIRSIQDKRPGGKIVIMGHSTGCQDCMEYLVGPSSTKKPSTKKPAVDGVILQAPCSDREGLESDLPKEFKNEADQLALKMCREGHDKDAMPHRLTKSSFGRMAITARRWLDVSSPGPDHSGADDYFSSDLPIERFEATFGKLPSSTPLLILMSGSDEYVPQKIDKEALVQTWSAVVKRGGGQVDEINSGVVPRASHAYNGDPEDVVQDMVKRVLGFVQRLDDGAFRVGDAKI